MLHLWPLPGRDWFDDPQLIKTRDRAAIILESAVERVEVCVCNGVGLGVTTRNSGLFQGVTTQKYDVTSGLFDA